MVPIADRILFEDNHLLVVNKLPSEIVQGDKTGDVALIDEVKQYLKLKYNKAGNVFAGLVHRIDRPVSGAVIFAKTSKALTRMTVMMKDRELQKSYLAIVRGKPTKTNDRLEHFLIKNESKNKSFVVDAERSGAKKAILDYVVIGHSVSYTLLEITLHTGRHHQIRAQLSAIGMPILGDLKYGDKRSLPDASISLHALRLHFVHPVTDNEITIVAPPSKESQQWQVFEKTISESYFL
ncbi:MAG: RluA family pseudouridine synthase [Bacteroidales bacterium]|nr:RluA family pseudouridine synthase [Bacteroidales bacterium]